MSGTQDAARTPAEELERHTRIAASAENRAIAGFWDWMDAQDLEVVRTEYDPDAGTDVVVERIVDPTRLLAAYHGIDLELVERGRSELLEQLRTQG